MKKALAAALAVLLVGCIATGCAVNYLKKPEALAVKKVAIISVYANVDIHDVEANKSGQVSVLKALVGKKNEKRDIESDEFVHLATYGLKVYCEELSAIPNWQVIPPDQILSNPKYLSIMDEKSDNATMSTFLAAAKRIASVQWATPPKMPYIPASSMTYGSGRTVIIKGTADPVKEAQARMAYLCKELDVDAVVIVGLDLAYKKGMLSGMKGTGVFGGTLGRAEPMVNAEVVIITKSSALAAESPLISQGGIGYADSQTAPMLKEGRPYLKDSDGKAVEAYNIAIKNSAVAFKKQVIKELSAK